MSLSVVVVDDHAGWRDTVCSLLRCTGVTVVGEAGDGGEAVEVTRATKPDVVVMDVDLPTLDGIEATRRIMRSCSGTQVVMLSGVEGTGVIERAEDAGATGYLVKTTPSAQIADGIKKVGRGERVFPNRRIPGSATYAQAPSDKHRS